MTQVAIAQVPALRGRSSVVCRILVVEVMDLQRMKGLNEGP